MSHGSRDFTPVIVTAELSSAFAGDAPQLDSLIENAMVLHMIGAGVDEPLHITKGTPCPPVGVIPIPMRRQMVGGWNVACCSSPILDAVDVETVQHFHKKFCTENAEILEPDQRLVIASGGGTYKSYRLPLKIRLVTRVRWFAFGNARLMRKDLRRIHAIGKKVAMGYGRVSEWSVEPCDVDRSWFADGPDGWRVLMRPLPLSAVDEGVAGWRPYFGACCAPYWHPKRFTEVAIPC